MKFAMKHDYLDATDVAWRKLWELVDDLSPSQMTKRISIKNGPARSAKDALAHHLMLLDWYREGLSGEPHLPAQGYNWSQTRDLNASLHDEYADVQLASIRRRLKLSHGRVVKLVETLAETELLSAGHFAWTGKLPLMSYIAPNTVSHYRWATRKIKQRLNRAKGRKASGKPRAPTEPKAIRPRASPPWQIRITEKPRRAEPTEDKPDPESERAGLTSRRTVVISMTAS